MMMIGWVDRKYFKKENHKYESRMTFFIVSFLPVAVTIPALTASNLSIQTAKLSRPRILKRILCQLKLIRETLFDLLV